MAYSRFSRDSHWYIFWLAPLTRGPHGSVTAIPREEQELAVWHVDHRDESPTFTYAQVVPMLRSGDFSVIPGYTDADRELIVGCLGEFIRDVDDEYLLSTTRPSEMG